MAESTALRELADRVLAKGRAHGFDDFEVSAKEKALSEMQIDAGQVSLLRSTNEVTLSLRAFSAGRMASVALNQVDSESLALSMQQLSEGVQAAPVDEARVLAGAQSVQRLEYGPTEPSLEQMHERITSFAKVTVTEYPDIKMEQSGLQFFRNEMVRLNTKGLSISSGTGGYSFFGMFSGKRNGRTSSFNYSGGHISSLDRELIDIGAVRRLMASSVREIDHKPLEGKFTGPVILSPECFMDLVNSWLSHLRDGTMIAGTSRLRDKLGQKVASPLLHLSVRPADALFAARELYTSEGYVSAPSSILESGVLKGFMLSDYGARRTALSRAANDGGNLVFERGLSSVNEMIDETKHGLFLQRFSGGYPAANGDFSGVAKNSYLIVNGELAQPLSEVMVSGNLFDLMNDVVSVSHEAVNDGTTEVPFVRVAKLTVTGK